MKLEFFVSGTPIPQPRPRACVRGKHAAMYDPGTADGWRAQVKIASLNAMRFAASKQIATGPIVMTCRFVFARPKSHLTARGELKSSSPAMPEPEADLDNLEKAVMDAITPSKKGMAGVWRDDCQVCLKVSSKEYGLTPGVHVMIETFDLVSKSTNSTGALMPVKKTQYVD